MKLKSAFFFVFSLLIFVSLSNNNANAQLKSGQMGMSAAIGMPSGLLPSVSSNGNAINDMYSLDASTSLNLVLSDNFQLDLGLGFMSRSRNEEDAQNLLTFGLGGKYFLSNSEVSPYITGGFSYAQLPSSESEISSSEGSILSLLGAFGVQSFVNNSKTIALFIQIGISYNMISTESTVMNQSSTTELNHLNLGASAIGATIYF